MGGRKICKVAWSARRVCFAADRTALGVFRVKQAGFEQSARRQAAGVAGGWEYFIDARPKKEKDMQKRPRTGLVGPLVCLR